MKKVALTMIVPPHHRKSYSCSSIVAVLISGIVAVTVLSALPHQRDEQLMHLKKAVG